MIGQAKHRINDVSGGDGHAASVTAHTLTDKQCPSADGAEIQCAVSHLTDMFGTSVPASRKDHVKQSLAAALAARFQGHWDTANPTRGCGFRCLVFPPMQLDRCVHDVLTAASVNVQEARAAMPHPDVEMMMWIDPQHVSMRVSERAGVTQVLYTASPPVSPMSSAHSSPTAASDLSPSACTFTPRAMSGPPTHHHLPQYGGYGGFHGYPGRAMSQRNLPRDAPRVSPPPGLLPLSKPLPGLIRV